MCGVKDLAAPVLTLNHTGTTLQAFWNNVAASPGDSVAYTLMCAHANDLGGLAAVAVRTGTFGAVIRASTDVASQLANGDANITCRVVVVGGADSNDATHLVPVPVPTFQLATSSVIATSGGLRITFKPLYVGDFPVAPVLMRINHTDLFTGASTVTSGVTMPLGSYTAGGAFSRHRFEVTFVFKHAPTTVLDVKTLELGKMPIVYSPPNATAVLSAVSASAVRAAFSIPRVPEAENDADGVVMLVYKQATGTRVVVSFQGAGPHSTTEILPRAAGALEVTAIYFPKAGTAGDVTRVVGPVNTFALPGPLVTLLSAVANDPDDGDAVFSVGDTVTLTLSSGVKHVSTALDATLAWSVVQQFITFSPCTGCEFTGTFTSASAGTSLVLTATAVGTSDMAVGVTSVTVTGTVLQHVSSGQAASVAATPAYLMGDFGRDTLSVFEDTASAVSGLETANFGLTQDLLFTLKSTFLASGVTGTLTVSTSAGTLRLNGQQGTSLAVSGSPSDMASALSTMVLNALHHTRAVVTAKVTRSAGPDDSRAVTVTLTEVNEQPAVSVPTFSATLSATVTSGVFSGLNITDPDVATVPDHVMSFYISTFSQDIKLRATSPVSGVTYKPTAGRASTAMFVQGTLPNLNAALHALDVVVDMPSLSFLTTPRVTVALGVDDLGSPPLKAASVGALTVVCPAVDLSNASATAVFNAQGSVLSVTLSQPYRRPAGVPQCGEVFSAATCTKLGLHATVYRRSPTQFVVFLGYLATIVPGDTLVLADSAVAACPSHSFFPALSIPVSAPANAITPAVRAFGPSMVSSCGWLVMRAQASAMGGRSGTWTWSAPGGIFSGVDTSGSRVVVAPSAIPPNRTYDVTVQVTNFVRGGVESVRGCVCLSVEVWRLSHLCCFVFCFALFLHCFCLYCFVGSWACRASRSSTRSSSRCARCQTCASWAATSPCSRHAPCTCVCVRA